MGNTSTELAITEESLVKIGQGLHLARSLLYSIMRDHNIYPSVGNIKYIDESFGELIRTTPPHLHELVKAATDGK